MDGRNVMCNLIRCDESGVGWALNKEQQFIFSHPKTSHPKELFNATEQLTSNSIYSADLFKIHNAHFLLKKIVVRVGYEYCNIKVNHIIQFVWIQKNKEKLFGQIKFQYGNGKNFQYWFYCFFFF